MHNLTEKVITGPIDDNLVVNNGIDNVNEFESNLKVDDDAINLSNIIRLAFHYRWLILIISFVTTLIAYSITAFVTPIYESQGTIIISTPSNKFSMAGNDISSLLMSSYGIGLGTSISNELEILNSRSLGYSLSQKIYEERFDQNGRLYPLLWRDFPRDSTPTTLDTVYFRTMSQKFITQKGNAFSGILNISFQSPSPYEAQRMVNLIIETYSEASTESNKIQVKSALTFLNKELTVIKDKVTFFEESLREYMKNAEVVKLDTQSDELIRTLSRLIGEQKEFEVKLAATNEAIKRYSAEIESIKPGFAAQLSQSIAPYIQRLQVQLAEFKTERVLLLAKNPELRADSVGEPRLAKLNDQIDYVYNEILKTTQKLLEDDNFQLIGFTTSSDGGLSSRMQNYREQLIRLQIEQVQFQTQINVLETQIQSYESFYKQLPDHMIELARKKRDLSINEQLYLSLAKQSSELNLWEQTQSGLARIVDLAFLPSIPIEPRPKIFSLVGLLIGLILSASYIGLNEFTNPEINSVEKMKNKGYPVIGVIPDLRYYNKEQFDGKEFINIEGSEIATGLVTLLDSISPSAEAYRRLQSNILYSRPDNPYKVILTTSSNKSEGKTTLSANLAVTFAETGKKVLLIDCDFRRPRIHKIFGFEQTNGIVDCLFTNEDPFVFIKPSLVENLYVFTIGMIPPNPSEIIRSEKFKKLINKLRNDFDFIILDTPPYGIITDAAPLINLADGIVAVAKFNQTKSIEFDFTLENLRKIKAPIIGLALTAFDAKKASGYYYSDYYYQYSYESYKDYDKRA
jgi:capsular exopolysaccharide synthesis family protein